MQGERTGGCACRPFPTSLGRPLPNGVFLEPILVSTRIGTSAAPPALMRRFTPLCESTAKERIQRRSLDVVLTAMLRTGYRLIAREMRHVPARGAALVISNHVSFIDFAFVGASLPRLPHFVMHHEHWRHPVLRWFFELHRVIPIAPRKEDPAMLEAAYDAIDAALAAGELVMIFPEGDMTHDGDLGPVRSGVERIVHRRPVPVVPLAIRGLWGSFFSRVGGTPPMQDKRPRLRRSTVEIVAGPPIPPGRVSCEAVASTLRSLRGAVC